MVNKNKILSDLSKMAVDAMSTFSGLKKEIETIVSLQVNKIINKMNLVKREEFEILKKLVQKVLIENEKVRVVRVTIEPGELEKMHTHKYHSVFIVNSLPEINYYDENMRKVKLPGRRKAGVPRYLEPEGVHAVENVGNKLFDGIRIELKEEMH